MDLEALVNDMNSSLESLYSSGSGPQTESTPLLHNSQNSCAHHHHTQNNQPRLLHTAQVSPEPPPFSSPTAEPPHTGLRRSQPMHILAVRLVFDVNSSFQFALRSYWMFIFKMNFDQLVQCLDNTILALRAVSEHSCKTPSGLVISLRVNKSLFLFSIP